MIQTKRTEKRQRRSAFTLMEMLVVVAIIVALASLGGYFFLRQFQESQEDIARIHIKGVLTPACKAYFLKHNSWPPSLEALTEKSELGYGPYLETRDALFDPWKKLYQYDAEGPKNNRNKPDISTLAPDGKEIGNWQ